MQDLPAETTGDLFTPIEVGPLTLPKRNKRSPRANARPHPKAASAPSATSSR